MALGRTRGRMSSVAAKQQAAQQRAMAQRTPQQRSGLRAMPQKPAAMPKQQVAAQKLLEGQMSAAQNKANQGSFMGAVQQRAMQQTPSLAMPIQGRSSMDAQSMRTIETAPRAPQKTFTQPVSPSPASMAPPKETAPRAAQVPVPQTQPRTTPPAMTPPAMRKGGAVKKKPSYAKGGMVMANCGASMKPQQKAKK